MYNSRRSNFNSKQKHSYNQKVKNRTYNNANNNCQSSRRYPIGYHAKGQKAFATKSVQKSTKESNSVDNIIRGIDEKYPPCSLDGWMKFGQNESSHFNGKINFLDYSNTRI